MLNYPSKILLFGEYTILNGSRALAVPWYEYSGHWSTSTLAAHHDKICHRSLLDFSKNHSLTGIDEQRLLDDVKKGIWFDSTIPHGQGIGSSGALIAAIYDRYGTGTNKSMIEIKKNLGELESYFHGSSSGLDPLVSYLKKALLIHSPEEIQILDKTPKLPTTFLINTKQNRTTAPLMDIYKKKIMDPSFKKGIAENLVLTVSSAIQHLLTESFDQFFHNTWLISRFQWDDFNEMIPQEVHSTWKQGLDSGDFVLKLCGAGGGGYILGFSKNNSFETVMPLINNFELKELKL